MEIEKDKQEILMKNNVLIKAKYDLNMVENKIFQLILFSLQKQDTHTLVAEINLNQFTNLIKRKNDKTIKALSDMLEEKFRKGSLEIKTDKKWLRYGFINGFTYYEETETFKITATKEIYDLLFDYLRGYTPVNLALFFSFKSYYTQRLYELLRLWSNTKQVINYKVDELREFLVLENKYTLYKDFKKRVITSAVKELNEKSLMQVEFKENKISRKVVSIDFIVKDNDKRKYFQDKQQDKSDNKKSNDKKSNQYNNGKTLRFNDYEQRVYDYDALEKKLLGWDNTED